MGTCTCNEQSNEPVKHLCGMLTLAVLLEPSSGRALLPFDVLGGMLRRMRGWMPRGWMHARGGCIHTDWRHRVANVLACARMPLACAPWCPPGDWGQSTALRVYSARTYLSSRERGNMTFSCSFLQKIWAPVNKLPSIRDCFDRCRQPFPCFLQLCQWLTIRSSRNSRRVKRARTFAPTL